MKYIEMDARVPFLSQLDHDVAPVILVNKFDVTIEDVDHLVKAWTADAQFFQSQPGFISAQLHRGIGGSCVFLNYAIWKSVDDFKRAASQPEFRSRLENYPASAVASPHLFQKIAIPGICAG